MRQRIPLSRSAPACVGSGVPYCYSKGYFYAYSTSKGLREFAVKYKIEFGKENVSEVVIKHHAINLFERVEVLIHACLPSAFRFSSVISFTPRTPQLQ